MKQLLLTPEELKKNIDIFHQMNEKYKIFNDNLLEVLGEGLYTSPASPQLSLNNCFPGGLMDHMIRVAKYISNINKLLPQSLQQEQTTLIKVAFLSQIGKIGLYKSCTSEWHQKNQGKYYDYNEDLIAMSIGERSAYIILKSGGKLEDYEYQAIINITKDLTKDNQAKYYSDVVSVLLKQAVELASIEEKEKLKKFNS